MRPSFRFMHSALFLGISTVVLGFSTHANAAETLVFKYQGFRESVSVNELTTFAETGEVSSSLRSYFRTAKQNPDEVRGDLNQPLTINIVTLDRLLNSQMGESILDQIGQIVHPRVQAVSRQALRSALVLSARLDSKISLIEVLQNYPTSQIEVEGTRLGQLDRQVGTLVENLQGVASPRAQVEGEQLRPY